MALFKLLINRNVPERDPETQPFSACARRDEAPVEGWFWTPGSEAKGTLFSLHGFNYHCWEPHDLPIAKKHDLAIVSFDFRHHGRSSNRWPSFGTAESWDLRGAMDKADELGLPRPFIVKGHSLGAMAAQRAAIKDERIAGCFLASPPQCPWHAVGSIGYNIAPPYLRLLLAGGAVGLANLINAHYGWQIIHDGDIRRHSQTKNPQHRPLVFFVMGDQDSYEIQKTREVYDHWYSELPEMTGQGILPDQERGARKWFATADGYDHDNIWKWPQFHECLESFIKRCLEETKEQPRTDASARNQPQSTSLPEQAPKSPAEPEHFAGGELNKRTGQVLHVDIGGGSVRTWIAPEMTNEEAFDSLRKGESTAMSRTAWNPEIDGRRLPDIIQEMLPADLAVTRVLVAIPDNPSPNGRRCDGWLKQKCGVPENLSEALEERLSLLTGSVTLLNDGIAWGQGAKALMRHSGVWNLGGVGVLAMGTGVGFAVVTQSRVTPKDLKSGYNLSKLCKVANHGGDVHVNLGTPYFKWMEQQGWDQERQTADATRRLELLIEEIDKVDQIDTFLVGGGHAPWFGSINDRFKTIYLTEETLGFDPGYIPLIGLDA
ncbi:MAG: alpha/beta hydrolase [Luteolibacter sp.]